MKRAVVLGLLSVAAASALPARAVQGDSDPILDGLATELDRNMNGLSLASLGKPYFLSYWVRDQREVTVQATLGSLTHSGDVRARQARVDLRVGDPTLDNSGFFGKERLFTAPPLVELPIDDDPLAIRRVLWFQTDRLYKAAAQTLESKKAYLAQKMGELRSPDFSLEPARVRLDPPAPEATIPVTEWESRVRDISAIMRRYPLIQESDVIYFRRDRTERLVTSEGTRVRTADTSYGLEVSVEARAADGLSVTDFEVIYGDALDKGLPQFTEAVERMCKRVSDRTHVPIADEYLGPVLLEDQAACEYIGQVFAPAVAGDKTPIYEDERYNARYQGPLLANRLNRRVLPVFLSAVDDPAAVQVAGTKLQGHFEVDQEGVPPQKVTLVDKGILKGLLMTRAPHEKIAHSNGHARAESGLPGARTSNLIIGNADPKSRKELREQLLDLVKSQELPYGIVIKKLNDELLESRSGSGGSVTAPVDVVRLYPDGREEEVRGFYWGDVSIRMLRDILAAGDKPYVYNYYQSGRGGTVLTSIASPALLLDEVELKATDRSQDKPPILESPLSIVVREGGNGGAKEEHREKEPTHE
ncbi:MAG: metallopeptidase TldD-related protein [Acidobacteriota bacterium]